MSTTENHDNLTVGEGMMQNATHRRHDWTNLVPGMISWDLPLRSLLLKMHFLLLVVQFVPVGLRASDTGWRSCLATGSGVVKWGCFGCTASYGLCLWQVDPYSRVFS